MMLVLNLSSIGILWFGSVRISGLGSLDGLTEVGSLFAFLQYAMQMLFALLMVSMMCVMLPRAEASSKRIHEVLAMRPEINDAEEVKWTDGEHGYVSFQDVTFSYPGAEEPALSNISRQAR